MSTWRVIIGLMIALIVLNLIERAGGDQAADVYVVILILGFVAYNQSALMLFGTQVQKILGGSNNEP